MCRFVREVRKLDGQEYPPNTLREMVILIQMFMHENSVNWKLLDDAEFQILRNVVDNTMKQRHAMGMGVCQSSKSISVQNENQMFRSRALGEENPIQFLRTVIYMIGLHCALRGGVEHNKLRRPNCEGQVKLERDSCGFQCMVYHEDPLQKTNQGGLTSKGNNKTVFVYPSTDVTRCPVRIFSKYLNLMLNTMRCKKLYL